MNKLFDNSPKPPPQCTHWDERLHEIHVPTELLTFYCPECMTLLHAWHTKFYEWVLLAEQADKAVTLKKMTTALNKEEEGESYFFVSVRPPLNISWDEFKRDVVILMDKLHGKTEGHLSFEQKGESIDTMGTGFHIHFLVKAHTSRKNLLQQVQRNFKYITNGIDIKTLKGLSNYTKVYDYITGEKEEAKKGACLFDDPWRKSLGLLSLYSINLV